MVVAKGWWEGGWGVNGYTVSVLQDEKGSGDAGGDDCTTT